MSSEARPWSGWRRLWAVLSVLLGAPILFAAYLPFSEYKYLDADSEVITRSVPI